ncbi:MAG: ATP-dependent helicase [Candidatus Micrarchaeaceae archaeon]|jgi:ATP-dependent Lhr-like helicase|nr:ATP-dependent helicase [Candidatus Micrarchaeota archaeon]HII09665.1 ATP-dependent helicase [Candidatus Micrarchaeota archaeon]
MITYADKPFDDNESLGVLNKYVREWFSSKFDELTPPQKYAFKLISEKSNVLITAPTGSGKTMSGFLSIISRLFDYSLEGKLEDKVYCLYISPLRALNNDIHNNLSKPLEDIYEMIKKDKGVEIVKGNIQQVRIGVRTGDTTQEERRKMLAKPPNILVTTPESLAILINSEKFVEHLKSVEYIIIDEVHELANNKRGVHLSLSVARLENIIGHDVAKVGLGATLYPLDEAAKYLVGWNGKEPKDCVIVDASWSKKLNVRTICPVKDMIYATDEEIDTNLYKRLNDIITKSKSTLIFTNTRSGTERVVFNLKKRFKYGEDIAAHHSSLSRESRLEVEELLKKGGLKCVVSSTSLELGVDIGTIENVVQLGSPKSVTRAVQRIGRAGHSYKATANGEIIVLNRDDLIECSVLLDAALKKHLDAFVVPQNALDVLAQHIIGMSLTKKWNIDEAYGVIRGVYAYHELPKEDYMSLINYLAGNYVGLESRRVYGKIWYDENEQMFGRRGKLAKVIYMLNLGTIPDEVAVNVFNTNKKWIGNIEEEFLTKLKEGDIFTLGGRLYKFEYAKGMKAYVSDAHASAPTIPPWFSEQLPLSYELASEIGEFREKLSVMMRKHMEAKGISRFRKGMKMPDDIDKYLSTLPIDENSKKAIFSYFLEQMLFADEVPTNKFLLIELTKGMDEKNSNYIVFHSLFGRRVNDALSRALALQMAEMFDVDIDIMINDNGFLFRTEDPLKLSQKDMKNILDDIHTIGVSTILKRNIRKTELMRRKFRHVAARSFMILRNYKGYKIPVGRQQMSSQLVFKAAEEIDPNFPVIKETYREIMNETMDLKRTSELIASLRDGKTSFKIIKTALPSPFSHSIITFGHADAVMMKERHKYLQKLHTNVMKRISGK